MKVGVIGSGISGLGAARALARQGDIDVEVLEAGARPGGHVYTVDVPGVGVSVPVDMGFIVYNEKTYPHLTRLFAELGVRTRPTTMCFSVAHPRLGIEWASDGLAALFAQKRNLIRPRHYRFLVRMERFLRRARQDAERGVAEDLSLADYLRRGGWDTDIAELFVIPLGAAIWSTPAGQVGDMPAALYLRFLRNHGMLEPVKALPWRTVVGGSRAYVERLLAAGDFAVRCNARAARLERDDRGVDVVLADGERRRYDRVVVATHSDQALGLLAEPTADEGRVLGAIRYTDNECVLHTDDSFLPRARRARASWNYEVGAGEASGKVCVTYFMNRLQGLPGPARYCVTLNPHRPVADNRVLHRARFAHPLLDGAAVRAQREIPALQGTRRTYYAGAYCANGFHEDGLRAGLTAAARLLADAAGERPRVAA